MRLRTTAIALAAAGVLAAAPAATAHVTVSPAKAAAGGFAFLELTVPHGCDGSPTTKITVKMPEGIASATPEAVPGWTVATTTRTLEQPLDTDEGEQITEAVDTISWEGGPLPDGQLTRFGLSLRLPEAAGETLYFPVVQECEQGETRWIQVPSESVPAEELEEPAPAVALLAANDAGGADGGGPATAASARGEAAAPVTSGGGGSDTLAIALGAAGLAAGLAALGVVLMRRRQVP